MTIPRFEESVLLGSKNFIYSQMNACDRKMECFRESLIERCSLFEPLHFTLLHHEFYKDWIMKDLDGLNEPVTDLMLSS